MAVISNIKNKTRERKDYYTMKLKILDTFIFMFIEKKFKQFLMMIFVIKSKCKQLKELKNNYYLIF